MEFIITIASCAIPIVGYYLYLIKSVKTSPITDASTDSVNFRIPEKSVKKEFFRLEIQAIVTEIEVLLIGGDGSKISKHIYRNLPSEPIPIKSEVTYSYKFKSKLNFTFWWSAWSGPQSLQRQHSPFCLPSKISKEHCVKLRNSIGQEKPCKILLLGHIGDGKSSFVNTLLTAFNDVWTAPAFSGPHDKSVTSEKIDYEVIPDKIILSDMPGWERNYDFSVLKKIMKGKYEKVTIDTMQGKEKQSSKSTDNDYGKIDVAIIVIGANGDEEINEVNKELFERLKTYKLPFITVVTKVDTLQKPNEREITTRNFTEDARVIRYCNEIRNAHSEHVFPIINYRNFRDENDQNVDCVALQILKIALKLNT